jgi:hypothetical protein
VAEAVALAVVDRGLADWVEEEPAEEEPLAVEGAGVTGDLPPPPIPVLSLDPPMG